MPATSLLPRYSCKKISRPLHLSGKIDDALWQSAPTADLNDALSGAPGRFAATVRGLYDDDHLYFAFACEDDYVWGTHGAHDAPIYEEECVEIFINPASAAHQYYEINVSPRNVVFDACILNPRTALQPQLEFIGLKEWHVAGLRTAVHIEGEINQAGKARGWSTEFAIPFHALIGAPHASPQPGDQWRVNFYRIDTPQHAKSELYAWSPTLQPTFHLPWRFGWLCFAG